MTFQTGYLGYHSYNVDPEHSNNLTVADPRFSAKYGNPYLTSSPPHTDTLPNPRMSAFFSVQDSNGHHRHNSSTEHQQTPPGHQQTPPGHQQSLPGHQQTPPGRQRYSQLVNNGQFPVSVGSPVMSQYKQAGPVLDPVRGGQYSHSPSVQRYSPTVQPYSPGPQYSSGGSVPVHYIMAQDAASQSGLATHV